MKIQILVLVLISAMVTAAQADRKYIPAGDNAEFDLGAGFNADTEEFKGSDCVSGSEKFVGRSSSDLGLTMSTSDGAIAKEFGMNAKVKYKFTGGSTSAGAKFVKNSQTNNRSLIFNFIARYDLKIVKD